MGNSRWNCKLTSKFVKLYLTKECLWNPKHSDYKDGDAKKVAYEELADAMKNYVDIDTNGVRTKIKNLRCTYIQEVAKIVKRSTDPDNIYEPSLPWFREMDKHLKNITSIHNNRPENKWGDQQNKETFQEEHLDEDFLENMKDQHQQQEDEESDLSDFIYTDSFGTRWSSDVTLKFVKCYLKHECLWNPKNTGYTNKRKKLKAYKDIIDVMSKYVKLDVNGIRTKIRNLRSTYNQEILKIMRKSTDPNHIYEPTMPWFKLMDEKLKDVVQLKSRLIRMDSKWDNPRNQHKEASNKIILDEELLQNIKSDVDCLDDSNLHQDDHNMDHEDNEKNGVASLFIPSHNTKDNFFEDEFDIFGRYIAAQLRKLHLRPAMQAKSDILDILTKARLSDL